MIYRIGTISNYYGELLVEKRENGSCYWCIPDHSSEEWEQIPPRLYDELLKFQEQVDKQRVEQAKLNARPVNYTGRSE